MICVNKLSQRYCIIRTALTLKDLLNPFKKEIIGKSSYQFIGGDKEIIELV